MRISDWSSDVCSSDLILQIGTDAGRVVYDGDAVLRQLGARPDAGQHQQLRRLDRTGGEQHFTLRTHLLHATAPAITHADRTRAVNENAARMRPGNPVKSRTYRLDARRMGIECVRRGHVRRYSKFYVHKQFYDDDLLEVQLQPY